MTQDARDKEQLWQRLQQSAFRRRFSLNPRDNDYMHAKGMTVILNHARDFIASRLAPALPAKDGKQTPWQGHPVFVAQHATATCCRGCLEKWYGIPRGVALGEAEQAFIVAMIALWLERHGSGGKRGVRTYGLTPVQAGPPAPIPAPVLWRPLPAVCCIRPPLCGPLGSRFTPGLKLAAYYMTIALPSVLRTAYPVRIATRVVFFIAGFAMSAWAPLVPFAKARLAINDASLGLLMLCLGIGSLLAMPLAAACVLGATLPLLAWLESMPLLALTLLLFGAGLGTLDITMNIQAVAVEKASGRAMMSGFHGFFSLGGIAGAGLVSALLACALTPLTSVLIIAAVLWILLALASTDEDQSAPLFVRPHGRVLAVGLLCFILFLTEGAMLDWSALFLTHERGMSSAAGGLGYALFCISMTLGRLCGDKLINDFGRFRMLLGGSLCAAVGLLLAIAIDLPTVTLLSFLLLGFGAANLVPLLFSVVGDQRDMPPHLALAAISGVGYAGILTGPALIGVIAHVTSLYVAFGCVAVLLLVVSASARRVTH